MTSAHISPFGGYWYPRLEPQLNRVLDEAFEASTRRSGDFVLPGVLAILVPHAAPCYSGTVAAGAYRHVQAARPQRVYILGFSHRVAVKGVAIPDVEKYRTPLGEIAVDTPTVCDLCAKAPFSLVEERVVCDHSVEIQLPYLQRAAPSAAVIPLCVGEMDDEERTQAAEALASAWRPGDVFVASSDLTHYGRRFDYTPFPVDGQTAARLWELDRAVLCASSSVDSGLFLEKAGESGATACGCQPIALLLRTLALIDGENIFQQEFDYQTSGEITGDFSASVSYAAAGYFQRKSFELNQDEREDLLRSARATLRHVCDTGQRTAENCGSSPALARRAPVFVSIHQEGRLMGCIGRVSQLMPLRDAVPALTLAAALDDPRRPAWQTELGDAEIEISVLTPMKLVRGSEAIQIGRDGAFLQYEAHSGLLLPQVAGADWTSQKFLEHLSMKAGLGPRAYDDQRMRLFVFQAQVFRI